MSLYDNLTAHWEQLTEAEREEVHALLQEAGLQTANAAGDRGRVRVAFERDLRPVCEAVAEALHVGDRHALEGLKAMLPALLQNVNEDPELARVLNEMMGAAVLDGMRMTPEEVA